LPFALSSKAFEISSPLKQIVHFYIFLDEMVSNALCFFLHVLKRRSGSQWLLC